MVIRSVAAWELEDKKEGKRWGNSVGHKETCRGDGDVTCLDCGDSFTRVSVTGCQTAQFKCVYFLTCLLYLNKLSKKLYRQLA